MTATIQVRFDDRTHRCVACSCIIFAGQLYRYVESSSSSFTAKLCTACATACEEFAQRNYVGLQVEELEEALIYRVRVEGPGSWAAPHLDAMRMRRAGAGEVAHV